MKTSFFIMDLLEFVFIGYILPHSSFFPLQKTEPLHDWGRIKSIKKLDATHTVSNGIQRVRYHLFQIAEDFALKIRRVNFI